MTKKKPNVKKYLQKMIKEYEEEKEFQLNFIKEDGSLLGQHNDVYNRMHNARYYSRVVECEIRISICYEILDYMKTGKNRDQLGWILTKGVDSWEKEEEREEAKSIKEMYGVD